MHEDEDFFAAKKRMKRGKQGKNIEDKVQEVLTELKAADPLFDFDRLQDSRAAGRVTTATVADFTFCYAGLAGALEVKSTKHAFRLDYPDFPQFPRLQRRDQAQALCLLVVYHSTEKLWRVIHVNELEVITRASWDLRRFPAFSGGIKPRLLEELNKWKSQSLRNIGSLPAGL